MCRFKANWVNSKNWVDCGDGHSDSVDPETFGYAAQSDQISLPNEQNTNIRIFGSAKMFYFGPYISYSIQKYIIFGAKKGLLGVRNKILEVNCNGPMA